MAASCNPHALAHMCEQGLMLIGVDAVLLFVSCGLSFARYPLWREGESCGSGPRTPRLKFLPGPHSSVMFHIYIQFGQKFVRADFM